MIKISRSTAEEKMRTDLLRFASTILIGVVTSLLAYTIVSLATQSVAIRMIATTLAAGLGLLLSYMFFLFSKFEQLERSILRSVSTRVRIQKFETAREARDHVLKNVTKCNLIWNTRFSKADDPMVQVGELGAHLRPVDDAILSEIMEHGCSYTIVYASDRRDAVQYLFDRIRELPQQRGGGAFSAYEINIGEAPLLQMILLNFRDGSKQTLVGWDMRSDNQPDPAVYLFDDDADVENSSFRLFRSIFETYQRAAGQPKVQFRR
jgi:predicted exporter